MKKYILITLLFSFFIINSYGQTWHENYKNGPISSIGISMDPNANLSSSSKNISIEYELSFKRFYLRTEMRYVDHSESSYADVSFAAGLHFSFFKKGESFYVGLREGGIYRNKKIYNTVGGEFGVNLTINKRLYLGLRTTLDYRTDMKIWNLPSKFVNSNYIKLGFIFW